MVEFGGACIGKAANSGTLTVIGVHLVPNTPDEIIQQIRALVVDPPAVTSPTVRISATGGITAYGRVQLVPVDAKTKWIIAGSIAVLVSLSTIVYNVTGSATNIMQFLEDYRDYFQTKIGDSEVPIDQAKQTIKNAEQSEHAPKNEHHESNPPATLSEGD